VHRTFRGPPQGSLSGLPFAKADTEARAEKREIVKGRKYELERNREQEY
jgi:hypothetical protein